MGMHTLDRSNADDRKRRQHIHLPESAGELESERRLPPLRVARSIGSMVSDVISLLELQVQLFRHDTSEAVQRTYKAAAAMLIGSLILLSCLPLGLLAFAHLLHQSSKLSLGASYAIVVSLGLLAGSSITFFGFARLRRVGNVYRRSQEELSQNARWLKSSFKR
jgi:hypothetical protein